MHACSAAIFAYTKETKMIHKEIDNSGRCWVGNWERASGRLIFHYISFFNSLKFDPIHYIIIKSYILFLSNMDHILLHWGFKSTGPSQYFSSRRFRSKKMKGTLSLREDFFFFFSFFQCKKLRIGGCIISVSKRSESKLC